MLQLMLFLERPQLEAGKIYFVCLEVIYSLLLQGMRISGMWFEGNVEAKPPRADVQGNEFPAHLPGDPAGRIPAGSLFHIFPVLALGYSKPRTSPTDQDLANEGNETWPGRSRGNVQK